MWTGIQTAAREEKGENDDSVQRNQVAKVAKDIKRLQQIVQENKHDLTRFDPETCSDEYRGDVDFILAIRERWFLGVRDDKPFGPRFDEGSTNLKFYMDREPTRCEQAFSCCFTNEKISSRKDMHKAVTRMYLGILGACLGVLLLVVGICCACCGCCCCCKNEDEEDNINKPPAPAGNKMKSSSVLKHNLSSSLA